MAITTYSELKSAVADWLNRDDLTSVVPSFISLAEADLDRKVRHWRMEKRATAQLDTQYSAVPADWVETIRFGITDGRTAPLVLMSQAEMLDRRAQSANNQGQPTHYAMSAGQIEVFPTPDATYNVELLYISKIPALTDAAPTNWLLTLAPDVYLYGALMQAAPYLKDDARVAIWAGLYQQGVTGLNAASEAARFSGSGLRLRNRGLA